MLLYYLLAFQLLFFQVFSAPTPPTPHIAQPTTYKPGDIVALRPTAYENKYDTNVRRPPALLSLLTESGLKIEFQQKDLPKHPGVILSGPTEKGHYRVAIVSNNPRGSNTRKPIKNFHPDLGGYVDLGVPKVVGHDQLALWLKTKTSMSQTNLDELKKEISK